MSEFEASMQALRGRFLERCAERIAELRSALGPVMDREGLGGVGHKVAGSAGMFGFPEVSAVAGELERSALTGDTDQEVRVRALALIAILSETAERGI